MLRLYKCCVQPFFERFVLFFCLKIERFVPETAEIWICGLYIIINCATKIILDHSEHRQNLPEVKAVLSITDEEIYMIESLQRTERWREFFIKMSNDAFIFRNEVSDFAAVAFDSRQATVVRLKQLFNESDSTYTAINRYLEERRKKYG